MIGRAVRAENCNLLSKGTLSMSKAAWVLIALTGILAGCGGAAPQGGAAGSQNLANQCAVCQMENPGYANSGLSSPCTQVCLASGQWELQYGPSGPAR
jgi:hypothetical protein